MVFSCTCNVPEHLPLKNVWKCLQKKSPAIKKTVWISGLSPFVRGTQGDPSLHKQNDLSLFPSPKIVLTNNLWLKPEKFLCSPCPPDKSGGKLLYFAPNRPADFIHTEKGEKLYKYIYPSGCIYPPS